MRETGLPFDDIKSLISSLPAEDKDMVAHTVSQLEEAGYPPEDRFRQICGWYSAWSGRTPAVHRGIVTLFAGTHSLDNRLSDGRAGKSVLDAVADISGGGSVINRLCHAHDFGLKVFDLALQLPVADISKEAALDERSCAGTIGFGMEAIAGGADLLCVSAVEPCITISALAILATLHDLDLLPLADHAGVSPNVIRDALKQVAGYENNPLEVLRRLGGRETAAICGAILAARSQHIPVVLGGLTAMAAVSVLARLNKNAVKHCMFACPVSFLPHELIEEIGMTCVLPSSLSDDAANGLVVSGSIAKSACLYMQGKPA